MLPCFDLQCKNSFAGVLSVQAVFICYVSMTTPQRVHAIDRTKTSIIPSLSLLPSLTLCPCRLLPVAELSTDICCLSLSPDLWPNVADKEVSVGTSRVRSGLSPGILVPGSSVGPPSLPVALHMCFLLFFRAGALRWPTAPEQGPFPEALFGLASGNDLHLGVCDRIPSDPHSHSVCTVSEGESCEH